MRIAGVVVGILINLCAAFGQVTIYSEPEPMHKLNSSDNENYLYLSEEGIIVFTREKSDSNPGGSFDPGDLWFATSEKIDSARSKKIGALSWMQTPIGYTPGGDYFLYSEVSQSMGQYTGKVKVFVKATGKHLELDIPHLKSRAEVQTGFLSRDGKILLLSLENQTGYGVEDLYVCFLDAQGKWSAPKGLGSQINTKFQEITPFLAPDNKTLFFATNGRSGFGSFDIFYSLRLDDTWKNWTEPQNIGSPVNTVGAETSFMFNEGADYAYFISTQNSDGYGDVKKVRIQPGYFEDEDTAVVAATKIEIADNDKLVTLKAENAHSGEPIAFQVLGKYGNARRVESGEMKVELETSAQYAFAETDSLVVELKAKGFLSKTVHLGYSQIEDNEVIVKLEPLETGRVIVLENVLFHRGTDRFIDSSMEELDLVQEMMMENPDVKIYLKGHTDNVGNKMLNIQLSEKRVQAVKSYLVSHGIDSKRVSGKGFGGSDPIADNRTEETRKLNRRVEFEVVRD